MNIHLTPELEAIIKAQLKSGLFRNEEDLIAQALQAPREKEQLLPSNTPNGEQRNAVAEMLRFVEANRVKLQGISVRELIHEDRR
jgi:Arc/MetJ-type ribon-helix-helix transcriptional regulator